MKKNISFIIPCFNSEKTIASCVNSIENELKNYQSISYEIIIVDDCSNDDTLAKCNEIKEQFPDGEISIIQNNKNMGSAGSRNAGINNANGEWIMFVDSDDELIKDSLGIVCDSIEKRLDVDFIFCGYRIQYNDVENSILPDTHDGIYTKARLISQIGEGVKWPVLSCIGNKLYRHMFLEEKNIRFVESNQYNEDGEFIVEVLEKMKKVQVINREVYLYKLTSAGKSFGYMPGAYFSIGNVINRLDKIISECGESKKQEKYIDSLKLGLMKSDLNTEILHGDNNSLNKAFLNIVYDKNAQKTFRRILRNKGYKYTDRIFAFLFYVRMLPIIKMILCGRR